MTQEPQPQLTDTLLTELLPRIQAAPENCRDDLRSALALAIAVQNDALRSSAFQFAHHDAELRRLGLTWATARHPLDPLLDLLSALTEKMFDFDGISRETEVTETGGQIIRAILTGFQMAYRWSPTERGASHDRRRIATALLWNFEVAAVHEPLLAENYAVVALWHVGKAGCELDEDHLVAYFERAGTSGALPFLAEPLSYLLFPASDKRSAAEVAEEFHHELPEPVWLAVTWRHRDEVPSGRQEAWDIARLVAVSERPPGVYQLDDVLVEYAVLKEPSVASRFVKILTPIGNLPMLLTTLKAFVAANGNRSKAAADLEIHRSTLDYRLQRIEQLTNTDPTNSSGLQLLSIALTTYTALHCDVAEPG